MTHHYHQIQVPRTAHYLVQGPPAAEAHTCTVACHGYGQLAEYMHRKTSMLADRGHRIISVEGLNKFYWEGTSGRPVATWMTSHHRLDEIQDFCGLLSAVLDQECQQAKRVVLLGFSQGGTTLWRWLYRHRPQIQAFINVAGWIPEDLPLYELQETYRSADLRYLYSDTDQYLTEERKAVAMRLIKNTGLPVDVSTFEGGHRVVPEIIVEQYKGWE